MWLWAADVMIVFLQVLKASIDDFEQLRQAMNPCSKTPEGPPNRDMPPLTKGYLIFLLITLLVITSYHLMVLLLHLHHVS